MNNIEVVKAMAKAHVGELTEMSYISGRYELHDIGTKLTFVRDNRKDVEDCEYAVISDNGAFYETDNFDMALALFKVELLYQLRLIENNSFDELHRNDPTDEDWAYYMELKEKHGTKDIELQL